MSGEVVMGRKVTAYFGTGCWDRIKRTGSLNAATEGMPYGDEGGLARCGGTYLVRSPDDAVVQALRDAADHCTDNLTVVMVEIDEDLLIPDEDRIAVLLDDFLDRHLPKWREEQSHTVMRWTATLPPARLWTLADELGGSDVDDNLKLLRLGLIGHLRRRLDGPDAPYEETAKVINRLCMAYRASVSEEWNWRSGTRSLGLDAAFRTLEAIGKAHGTKILGAATVILGDDGLEMSDVKTDGYCPSWFLERVAYKAMEMLVDEGRDMTVGSALEEVFPAAALAPSM